MLAKLETKLKREVQQRIESQRKLHKHLHDTGAALESNLLTRFDEEINTPKPQNPIFKEEISSVNCCFTILTHAFYSLRAVK